ncbi:YqaJ viral recombinase family protein [Vaginisenegalia massiliensis]|uniref:YqaJ viral recombinase family nuclease n=1 Tax=Vaginisenegalia massiliensis TaxID=2058294 RepID=UPI000F51FE36|nr:YqaJ viral recombinase family protein [Vaginisenegalia massiliensis]
MPSYKIAKDDFEWHALRKQGLGGSDIGAVMGVSPFKSPYHVWVEKRGMIEPEDISDRLQIQIGNELEDLVARIFTQETGLQVQRDNKTYFHKDHPFLLANIDRKIIGKKALLECKTTGQFNAKQWEDDEVPANYLLQVQHYLNVLDYDYAYIAVIIGNNQFEFKKIERDNELIELYTAKAKDFWERCVVGGEEPEIDGSELTKQALGSVYLDIDSNETQMDADQINMVEQIVRIKGMQKQLENDRKQLENRLKSQMGKDNVSKLISADFEATWRNQSSRIVDIDKLKKDFPEIHKQVIKVSESKVLRIKNLKKENDE